MQVPVGLGGKGFDFSTRAAACGLLAGSDFGFAMSLVNSHNIALRLCEAGMEEARERYQPALLAGQMSACTALTEPGTGSDFAAIRTTAQMTDTGWVLEGEKAWIINGRHAGLSIVYAQCAEIGDSNGIGAFLVDLTAPGVERAFAKMQGAHVTVISSSDEKLKRVADMGADATINYRTEEDWARASRPITADRGGYDNIIELGGAKTLPLSLRAVRPGGILSMIGVLSGLNIKASLGPIVARQVRLQGVTVGHRDGFEAMLRAMAQHELHPVLGETFKFAQLKEALNHLRDGGHFGKTLIEF
ncbi:UNVERIFIED_CONTAM: hypothetical protein GTU68_006267 [Idotea baltica]|nr:hypothetical protein [Idotea baltica]